MLARSGSWVGTSTAGAISSGRWWFYQDFAAGSGPGITLTGNDNGSGGSLSWNSANVVTNSAVVTDTNGNPVFSSTTETPANEVSVSSNSGATVTLNATVDASFGTVRIWYLYTASTGALPANMEVAPDFVKKARIEWLDSHFLNQNLNLSDITSASTARTNLGLTSNTAGQVLYGDGTSVPTSSSSLFYDTSNVRLGVGTNSPQSRLHLNIGSAAAIAAQFTNSTTGATSSDGSIVGIDSSGNLVVTNQESLPIIFSAGGAEVGRFLSAGNLLLKNGLNLEDPGAGTNTISLIAPTLVSSYTLALPTTVGTNGYALTTDGTSASTWTSPASFVGLTTKGDLLGHTGAALTRLAVGTYGQVLLADSSASSGLAWGAPIRSNTSPVAQGATFKAVVFTNAMPNTNYSIIAVLANYTDGPPVDKITVIPYAKSTGGFTVEWDSPTGTANYVLEWQCIGHIA